MSRFAVNTVSARPSSVITYDKVRITVLTPCLVRVETGTFTDEATQTVWKHLIRDPLIFDLVEMDSETREFYGDEIEFEPIP